jgi:uncharacterized protein YlxP (DUF503 family)
MLVGIVVFELHIEDAQSLKEKRMVVRSLKDRLRNKFPVSIAEVGLNDLHQRARIGLAVVSNDAAFIEKQLDAVERFVEEEGGAELVGWTQELINFEAASGSQLDLPGGLEEEFMEKDEEES